VLAGLAHLNHHVREDADADARFCRDLASRLELPAFIGDADVPAGGEPWRLARSRGPEARQQFYMEALSFAKATVVAVAHARRPGGDRAAAACARRRQRRSVSDVAAARTGGASCARADAQRLRRTWRRWASRARGRDQRRSVHSAQPDPPRSAAALRTINAQADAALTRAADALRADAEFLETLANAAFVRTVEPKAGRYRRD
jgi:hypothetical protein